jgi:hypothetical protein
MAAPNSAPASPSAIHRSLWELKWCSSCSKIMGWLNMMQSWKTLSTPVAAKRRQCSRESALHTRPCKQPRSSQRRKLASQIDCGTSSRVEFTCAHIVLLLLLLLLLRFK